MANLKHNVLANFAGRAWSMLMSIVFVPIYLRLLGIEAYGLIGFFATLQGVLGIMDLGLSFTLNREFARSSTRPDEGERMASLLRTLEAAYWSASVLVGIAVVAAAPWIAAHWVNAVNLSPGAVETSVRTMGIIVALQSPFALYQGGLNGLQKQVSLNAILALLATLGGGGAVLVLLWLSPTVQAYFLWQVAVAALATVLCGWTLWRALPVGFLKGRFDAALARPLWRYAGAVSANALAGLAINHLDKLILIRLLDLAQFGYYALANTVAGALWAIILPLDRSFFPRYAQLHEQDRGAALSPLYHRSCQLMAVLLLPSALVLALFSYPVLHVWTGNDATAHGSALLVSLLTVGIALSGVASLPAYLQAASGWPGLILRTNATIACVLVPLLLFVVPRFGALGAAWVWVAINSVYVLVTTPLMHRRLLRGELKRWYLFDLLFPALAVAVVLVPARLLFPESWSRLAQLVYLFAVWAAAILAALLASSDLRELAERRARHYWKLYVLRDPLARWHSEKCEERLRYDYPLGRESVVLDLGGFKGDWAAGIHERYGCRILVFEPIGEYFGEIRSRFQDLGNIEVFNFGLAGRNAAAEISLGAEASSLYKEGERNVPIRLVAISEFLSDKALQRIDLVKINIEGAEYDLLDHMIAAGLVERFTDLQIQFHRFVPDAEKRREAIRAALARTHRLTYDYPFVWENWRRK